MPRCVYNAPARVEANGGVLEQDRHDWQAWSESPLGKGEQAVLVLGGALGCHNEQGVPAQVIHTGDAYMSC